MIDIHCHLLPAIDDGPATWEQSLAMARLAVADGTHTVIATPHQLGTYRGNVAVHIRELVRQLQARLHSAQIPLNVLPGGDVRVDADLTERLRADEVLTLADRHRHVLLELPHELYFPLGPVLQQLQSLGLTGILSHPERNQGLLADPGPLQDLVARGCLMQITAGSLLGAFGRASQRMAAWMLQQRLVHFVASDAHGTERRRPQLHAAYVRVEELTDRATANHLCHDFPARICSGEAVPPRPPRPTATRRRWFGLTSRARSTNP